MTLVPLLVRIALVTATLLGVAAVAIVGTGRIGRLPETLRGHLRDAAPYLAALGAVLLLNNWTRQLGPELSWLLRIDITGVIYDVEGAFVPWLQSFASPPLTAAFSFVYVYGYVFVLAFPVVAYLAIEDPRPLRETCLAYSFNYAIGLVLYVIFIAYGPRNLLPEMVESLMYANWPESQLLTSEVNTNTNVFPSLHASLATTVAIMAYRTRRVYPAWLYLSSVLAVLIAVATMYLGIHWGIDVVAGAVLGTASVLAAARYDPVVAIQDRIDGAVAGRLARLRRRWRDDRR